MLDDCIWLTNGLQIGDADDSKSVLSKACCRSKHNQSVIDSTDGDLKKLVSASHSPEDHIQKLKNPLYNFQNLKDTVCKTCHEAEKGTGQSMRTVYAGHYTKKVEPGTIRLLQVSFGNFCNFKCRYCTPTHSTSWNDDTPFMNEIREQNKDSKININHVYTKALNNEQETYNIEKNIVEQLSSVDLSHLQYVGVFGGEPFLSRHWKPFVELLSQKCDISKVRLQINSNFSIFPKSNTIEVLKKFGHIDLRASVEATGKLAEYIRAGLQWTVFEKNYNKWKDISVEYPNIRLQIHMTNNVYSINKVSEFEEWLLDTSNGQPKQYFPQYLYTPEFLDLRRVLTEQQLDICIKRIEKMKIDKLRKSLLNFVSSKNLYDADLVEKFKLFNGSLDKSRTETLGDVNPELAEWILK